MGTRGAFGFRVDGKDYLVFNRMDSYPSILGVDVLNSVQEMDDDTLERIKRNLPEVEVSEEGRITKLEEFGATVLPLYNDFIRNGLFCKWAYIVDLDQKIIEIYRGGFEHSPQGWEGRYYGEKPNEIGYHGCALVNLIPMNNKSLSYNQKRFEDGWKPNRFEEDSTTSPEIKIERVCVLNVAHVSSQDFTNFLFSKRGTVLHYPEGLYFTIPPLEEGKTVENLYGDYPSFVAVINHALLFSCSAVKLDRDGRVYNQLKSYEWD